MKDVGASLDSQRLDLAAAPTLPMPPSASWLRWSAADATLFAGEAASVAKCHAVGATYDCSAPTPFVTGPRPLALSTTPADPKVVYVLSNSLHHSIDGGVTFVALRALGERDPGICTYIGGGRCRCRRR